MSAQIERIPCGNVNSFLVHGGKSAILVDTGREKNRQAVLDACRGVPVRLLLLTHGHVDHVQNAAFLSEALGVPAAIHRADLPLLADQFSQPLTSRGLLGRVVLKASLKSFRQDPIPPFSPSVFLSDGDTLEEYGVPARVLSLPGHTAGSIGLDVEGTDLLVGDALMNLFYPTRSMLFHDRAAMEESARRISALGRRTIHFGHGSAVENRAW